VYKLQGVQATGCTGYRVYRLEDEQATGWTGYRTNGLQDVQATGCTGYRMNRLQDVQATGCLKHGHKNAIIKPQGEKKKWCKSNRLKNHVTPRTLEIAKWNRIKILHLPLFQNCVRDKMNKCPHMVVWKESIECNKEAAWYKIFISSLRTDQKEPTALVTVFKQTATTSLWWQYSIVPSLSVECQQSCQMGKIQSTL
jgi:hypothetical protein